MMADSISTTEECGGVGLDIGVDLETDSKEDGNDAETTLKELLDLIDWHEKRSQSNIESPLEINLGIEVSVGLFLLVPSWKEI